MSIEKKKEVAKVDADVAYEIASAFREEAEIIKNKMNKKMAIESIEFVDWINSLEGIWFDNEYKLWNIPDTDVAEWREEVGYDLPKGQFRFTTEEMYGIFVNLPKTKEAKDTITSHIRVSVKNIQIDDRYFSFDYEVWKNGNRIKAGTYDAKHNRRGDKKEFENDLKKFYAAQLAVEDTDFRKPS